MLICMVCTDAPRHQVKRFYHLLVIFSTAETGRTPMHIVFMIGVAHARTVVCLYRFLSHFVPVSCVFVFQYTPPVSAAEYVHRVGRTARIGTRGNSLLFLTPSETAYLNVLANHNIGSANWLFCLPFLPFTRTRHTSHCQDHVGLSSHIVRWVPSSREVHYA